jgi:hypothetical protein
MAAEDNSPPSILDGIVNSCQIHHERYRNLQAEAFIARCNRKPARQDALSEKGNPAVACRSGLIGYRAWGE